MKLKLIKWFLYVVDERARGRVASINKTKTRAEIAAEASHTHESSIKTLLYFFSVNCRPLSIRAVQHCTVVIRLISRSHRRRILIQLWWHSRLSVFYINVSHSSAAAPTHTRLTHTRSTAVVDRPKPQAMMMTLWMNKLANEFETCQTSQGWSRRVCAR